MIGLGSDKKRWSIDCIAKVRELIGVSKRKVKADYDVVDALLCTCKRGSVSKCQNHDDGDDVDDVVDALLCTCCLRVCHSVRGSKAQHTWRLLVNLFISRQFIARVLIFG